MQPDLSTPSSPNGTPSHLVVGMTDDLKQFVKSVSNIHRPDGSPNVFLFSLPRSGSTWLMELIWSQPGFKCCNEPTDLRNPRVRQHLNISNWQDMYSRDATPLLQDFFQAVCDGQLGAMNPKPFHRHYRPHTRRIVFKMIHGCEDRINWFRDTFNGRVIYLIRHPIAVSLSRESYPTLPALINGEYRRHFNDAQIAYAQRINETGTKLEQGVLSWCLQNAVPLREATADWVLVSYEQMIVDPSSVIQHIADKLELPDPERIMKQLHVPSHVQFKSDSETQRALESGEADQRLWLLEKWRQRISEPEERGAMEIVERFGIDAYRFGSVLPSDRVWIQPSASQTDNT